MGKDLAATVRVWQAPVERVWMKEAKEEMERELTVHVVTVVCMRHVAARVMTLLRDWTVDTEPESFGVGWRLVCRFPEAGVLFSVDQGVRVHLWSEVVIVLIPDDSLCGGATVTSRWVCPEV